MSKLAGCIWLFIWLAEGYIQDKGQNSLTVVSDSVVIGNLHYKLEVLNSRRVETIFLGKDSRFYISLTIRNSGSHEENLWTWDHPATNASFFNVYKIDTINADTTKLGKSFELSTNTKDLQQQVIPPGSELKYIAPWLPEGQFIMPVALSDRQRVRRYRPVSPAKTALKDGVYMATVRLDRDGRSINLFKKFHVKQFKK